MTGEWVAGTRVRPVELKADWDINAQCGPEDANALTDSEKRLNRDEIEALITICDGCPVILQCASAARNYRACTVFGPEPTSPSAAARNDATQSTHCAGKQGW